MHLKYIALWVILLWPGTSFAGSLTFKTRTFDFDGGPRTEYYAPVGQQFLIYRPLANWRFWKTDSGGAFENRDDPRAGQLKFYTEPAPFRTSLGEVEEEQLVTWFRRFVPAGAENLQMVELKPEYSRFLSSTLSSCQFNYDYQGRSLSLKIWAHPIDDDTWLCFTYGNVQGEQFTSTLGKLQRTFIRLNLEDE